MCVGQSTPRPADVTVTKIAGYVRVCILMNQWFSRIFGIHTFYATATLLNIWICMQWTCSWRWWWGRIGLCTHGVTTQVMMGVSLRARRDTTQVMLGLSLRARWDTTLVMIMGTIKSISKLWRFYIIKIIKKNSVFMRRISGIKLAKGARDNRAYVNKYK